MTPTSPTAFLGIFDNALGDLVTPSSADAHALAGTSVIADRKNSGGVEMSLEPNFWLLTRDYRAVYDEFFSSAMSDAAGDFAVAPVILLTSSAASNSSQGLTIFFQPTSGDYCTSIKVGYYNSSDVLIREDTYTPADYFYSTGLAVSGWKYVRITIYSTSKPYRRARVTEVDFGNGLTFTGSEIKELNIVEQVDVNTLTQPFNSGEMRVISDQFSMLDHSSLFGSLREGQVLDLYETVGTARYFMGRFFLSNWESESETVMNFKFTDALGVASDVDIVPNIYSKMNDSLAFIISPDYQGWATEVAAKLCVAVTYNNPLHGGYQGWGRHLKGTVRENVQRELFMVEQYASCARSRTLVVNDTELASDLAAADCDYHLATADILTRGRKLTLLPIVNGVEMKTRHYARVLAEDGYTFYSATLDAGDYAVSCRSDIGRYYQGINRTPVSVVINAIDRNEDKVYFTVGVTGAVTLTAAHSYIESQMVAGKYDAGYAASPMKRLVQIDAPYGRYEMGTPGGDEVHLLTSLYDYFQQRYALHFRAVAPQYKVGDSLLVDLSATVQMVGIVEKMDTDLAGGFISEVDIVGVLL